MTIELILEKNDGMLWGIVENKGNFQPTPYGKTEKEVIDNLKKLIKGYLKHEGINDPFWKKVDFDKVVFDIRYDLQAFFEVYDYLNISAVAKRAGINAGLLRQYASGVKYPSAAQAQKIEDTIHTLAKELKKISIYA